MVLVHNKFRPFDAVPIRAFGPFGAPALKPVLLRGRMELDVGIFRRPIGERLIDIKPLAWIDLLTLYRYREQALCLDNALGLTRGNPAGPWAMLAYLHPEMGVFTGVIRGNGVAVFGQMQYTPMQQTARLAFLLPESASQSPMLPVLLDGLACQAGEWGALRVLAELDEANPVFQALRKTGFVVYARQRVWKLAALPGPEKPPRGNWSLASPVDEIPVRSLYQSLVPPLVQSAEAFPPRRFFGWIYRQDGEILAYMETLHGPHGILMQPLVHPALEDSLAVFNSLAQKLNPTHRRPVYLAVRSYQSWVDSALESIEAHAGPMQALMVRHLARLQRAAVPLRHGALENYHGPSSAAFPTQKPAEPVSLGISKGGKEYRGG